MANGEGDDLEHVAALRGEGYALIYTPTGKPFRVRLDKLTGKQMKAWWFDPRTGKATAAGQFAKEGEREFTPPGSPGVGHDWVLALDDATKDLAAPGTKAYDGAATQTGSPDGTSLAADMRAASDRIVFPEDPSVMNVKRDFGAVGDGVANDTAALQAGIEASCGRGGSTKILFVPNGTYRVTNTLVVRSGVGPWVYGESRDGVVIRLTDDVPTNITSVLRTHPSDTQASSADFFMRNFRNFTIDVGDNPTVDGIRWYGNNSSALQNVRVAGTGHIGVNSGFLGQNGPNLIQDVTVEGSFETGIRCAWSWGQTLSRVTVRHARHEGVYVNATAVGIEDLVVEDTPVALRNEYPNTWTWWGGVVALVGGRFTGSDPSQPAITNTSVLYARNVTASGFKQVLQSTTSGGSVTGSRLEEYCSHPVQKLFPDSPDASFKLPILPEPGVPWETNLANWVCANTYGAAYGDGKDDTAAIQAAIYAAAAAGKTVVYLRGIGGSDPNCYNVDGEIRVHGSARQIIALGFGRIIGGPEGRFVVDDASAPRVKFQHLQAFGGTPCVVENRSAHNTLMVESCDMKVLGTGTGDIFLTDCPSHVELRSPGQRLWARQLNPEGDSDRGLVQNHGGRLWALGVKHEGRGVRWLTEDGGQTEILGLFNYAPDIAATDLRPEFDVSNACFCAMGVWEISFGNTFPVKVRETRLGDTRTEKGGGWIGWALYSGWSPSVTNAEAADLQNRIFDHSNPPRPPGPGTGNITFPTNSGVIDVTAAPYLAKGDGIADDTQSIQSALNDHPNEGAIIYLPNGTYLISQTLRWPRGRGGGSEYKNTILQGQSSAGTVIRLKDACPGFTDPAKPAEMVWTGGAPAQRFRNAIRNLTFDTGRGNPNAIGVRFDASNVGCLRDTVIRSGDGSGVIGLDQSYADDFGPCFVKNVTVIGFDTGIAVAHGVNGIVYENITLRGQRKMGWENRGMPITIRNLVSENSVTALRNVEWYGLVTLVDAQLTGTGAASALPAIDRQAGGLFARNLTVSGYACAIQSEDKAHPETVPGPRVAEWVSSGRLPGSGEHSLGLPVEETPDVPWDDPKDWAVITDYGAKMDGHSDDSDALQAAIDSGKTTVCLPRGTVVLKKPIVLRGSVRRLIGCEASLKFPTPMTGAKNIFTVGESPEPVLVVERFASWFWDNHSGLNFIDNPTKRTLVLRELGDVDDTSDQHPNGHGTIISGPGDLFIEDVTGRFQLQPGTHAWMRYVNPETNQDHRNTAPEAQWHLQNDGGQLWILGIKTEGPGPVIITRDGGATELLGGLMYSSGGARTQEQPAFIVADSRASFTITEANFGHNAYPVLVRQLRDGQVVFKLKPGQTPSGPGGSMIPLWSTP
jgi:polygalacturonase